MCARLASTSSSGTFAGAWLLPVDLIASAPAVLPEDGRPVLVYCEHGVRSVAASRLLSAAGIDRVLNLAGGLAVWTGPREFGPGVLRGPSSWLIQNADLLPRGGKVLDVACGGGRHALLTGECRLRGPRHRSRSGRDRRSCAIPPLVLD